MAPTGKLSTAGYPNGQNDQPPWPDDPGTVAVLDAVVAALDGDREAMVEAVMTGMERTVPSYGALPSAERDVVRDGVRLTVSQFVDLLVERRRLSTTELARIEALGGVRAAQGVPLDDMLDSIRAAMSAGWTHVLAQVPLDGSTPAVVHAVGRLADEVFQYMQQCAAVMSKGYAAHQRLGLAARIHARDEAIEELLSGLFDSDADVHRRAAAIGLDLDLPHGLLLFAGPAANGDGVEPLRRAKDAAVERLQGALDGSLRGTPTLHAVVVVPAPSARQWDDAMRAAVEIATTEHVLVLAGGPTAGASAIHGTYVDAARLVRIARQVATPPGIVRPDDLGVYRFLDAAGPAEGRAFVSRVLGPLLEQPTDVQEKLLEALRAHGGSGLVSDAADRLGVHPKTLSYRLRRVREITGLDPDKPVDRLQLDTAALLLQLHQTH